MAYKKTIKPRRKIIAPKKCAFCEDKKVPVYSDVGSIQKYITDRGMMIGRVRTGLCAKHQRRLTDAIKYARHLALLPYVSRD
ncbi:MAG: 30S ribosomal protein S18 [Candidatus Levybacteria bacterium]|nr:30S ribosomal protein S18 [Candidatus Levybacteria bacterium]